MKITIKYSLISLILSCIFFVFIQAKSPKKEKHQSFYDNGVLKEKGWLKNGEKYGIWWNYYNTGVRKSKEKYKKGVRIYLFEYNEKGLIFKITNKKGVSKEIDNCGC